MSNKDDDLPVLTLTPEEFPRVFRGVSRTRVFEALRQGKIRAKKDGKATIITVEEGMRYIDSLPDREVASEASTAA